MKNVIFKTTILSAAFVAALVAGLSVAQAGDPNPRPPTLGGVVNPPTPHPGVDTHPPITPITGRH